jgi:prepilin-type N-terminal cleavage/methylation domain-containing protein
MRLSHLHQGFTLIELLIVISIIGILSGLLILALNPVDIIEKANYQTAVANLNQIARAAQQYEIETGDIPPDANRNIPTEFMAYLGSGNWPSGPFKGSIYDWDNWLGQTCWDGSEGGTQITLREINRYKGVNYEANGLVLYYVIKGEGVPHCFDASVRGYCVNCESRYPPTHNP